MNTIQRYLPERVFFTADTHFGHEAILRYCNRPFEDVNAMNDAMIRNWNRVVGKDDIVFHLGDFCHGGAGAWNSILDRLNGSIMLVLGNHDLKNMRPSVEARFGQVAHGMCVEIAGKTLYLCHYPFLCFPGGMESDAWQLFGHVHSRAGNTGYDAGRLAYLYPTQLDVGVDANNFTPLSFGQVKTAIENRLLSHPL